MRSRTIWRAVAAFMLALIAVQRYVTARKPMDVGPYQQRIREAAARVPERIGSWIGTDVPVPVQAMSMLKPNVMISRRYLNVEDGSWAGVLIEHCSDAHDMAGHFPLRCYPARGWELKSSRQRDWKVGDLVLTGMEYDFTMDAPDGSGRQTLTIANCLLRPGGIVVRDMNALAESVARSGGESAGAGQLQVYFPGGVSQARRDEAVTALLTGYRGLIDAILANPRR